MARSGATRMTVVVKVGTSSITSDARRARRRRAGQALRASSPTARAAGHEVVLVCSGAIAAGLPGARACRARPTDIGTLQAIAAVGQPRLMERFGAILGRARRSSPGRCCSRRTTSARARSTSTPARRCPAARPRRRARWSTRTTPSPTTRSATATTTASPRSCRTWSAPTCSCCSPTPPACSPPTRGSTPTRRSSRRSPRSTPRSRRSSAAPGTARGSGGMATQARGGEDRRVVGRAGRHRRRRRARRGARRRSPGRPVGTVVQPRAERLPSRKLWIAFARRRGRPGGGRRRRPPGAGRRQPLAAPGRGARRRGRVRRRGRGRGRRQRRPGVREGPGRRERPDPARRSPAAAPTSSPTAPARGDPPRRSRDPAQLMASLAARRRSGHLSGRFELPPTA